MAGVTFGQRYAFVTLAELAARYGFKNYTGAASAIRRLNELAEHDRDLAARLEEVAQHLDACFDPTCHSAPR